jgi:hypothetical protein
MVCDLMSALLNRAERFPCQRPLGHPYYAPRGKSAEEFWGQRKLAAELVSHVTETGRKKPDLPAACILCAHPQKMLRPEHGCRGLIQRRFKPERLRKMGGTRLELVTSAV